MSNGVALEDSLAKRYRQPRGVEQFGIEAIPPELKTVRWWDLFSMVVNFLVNPGTIVVGGAAIAAGLSFWSMLVTEMFGISMAFVVYIIVATIGVDYGIPGQVGTRMAYGIRGSKWVPSLLRTLSSVYWFAFQTISGALGIMAVLEAWLHHSVSLVAVSLVFAVFQVFIATVGYDSLKILSRYAFILKIVFTVVILTVLMTHPVASYHPSAVFSFASHIGWKWAIIAVWANSAASAWFSMCTDAADFCRYSKTRVDMWIGTLLAAIVGQTIAVFLGGYAVAATLGKDSNPFDVMVKASGATWIIILILVYVVIDNWTVNVLNLYTGGLSLSNIFTKLGRFWTTLICSVIGVVLSLFPSLVNGYTSYMNAMGNLFSPVAGVLIFHYVFFLRGKLDVPALFLRGSRYWYWAGFNWVAIAWTIIGYFTGTLIPDTAVNIFSNAVLVGILYYITMSLIRNNSAVREGIHPAEAVDFDAVQFDQSLIESYRS